jgi:6-phosphofructokinase
MPRSNLMIVQSGGPTAVFNSTLAEVVAEAQRQPSVASILGARYGMAGLVRRHIVDLTSVTAQQLDVLRQTPGAALGSSRHNPSDDELERLIETLRDFKITLLLFIGGNGTMRGAARVSELCHARGLDVQVVGVPKTVDNDVAATDRCPGYPSAARYMIHATRELGADIRSLPQPVTVLETMGRNVGWIAAAAALARNDPEDDASCPQLVYLPELPFDAEDFLSRLDQIVARVGWGVVVVSEGIRNPDGSFVYQSTAAAQADPLQRPMTGGVAQHLASLVSERLHIRCRSEKPGLLGRACMSRVSPQDVADAALVGRAGVQALVSGARDVMVALYPLHEGVESATTLVPLATAAVERAIPPEWLHARPIPVNQLFLSYLRPLVGQIDEHLPELGTPVPNNRSK